MALTPIVTKVDVTGAGADLHNVKLNLKVNDGGGDVIDQDFSVVYRTSHDTVSVLQQKIQNQMQLVIDAYKSHDLISTSVGLSNAIGNIQSGLTM